MFPQMRRKKYEMSKEEAIELLNQSNHGVLAMISENGYPYTVFVNHVYLNGKIYIHCAKEGHKIDCIRHNSLVTFSTAKNVQLEPSQFSTSYTSIICFGKAKLIDARLDVLHEFIRKFSKEHLAAGLKVIERDFSETQLIEIEIDHITGKNTHKE